MAPIEVGKKGLKGTGSIELAALAVAAAGLLQRAMPVVAVLNPIVFSPSRLSVFNVISLINYFICFYLFTDMWVVILLLLLIIVIICIVPFGK